MSRNSYLSWKLVLVLSHSESTTFLVCLFAGWGSHVTITHDASSLLTGPPLPIAPAPKTWNLTVMGSPALDMFKLVQFESHTVCILLEYFLVRNLDPVLDLHRFFLAPELTELSALIVAQWSVRSAITAAKMESKLHEVVVKMNGRLQL